VGAVLALFAGCATPPTYLGDPRLEVLHVADARDGSLTRLDGASGRRLGPSFPTVLPGLLPAQITAGAGGAALMLSRGVIAARGSGDSGLTLIARTSDSSGWGARPVHLGAGARAVLLAGDGGAYAAVVYASPADGDANQLPAAPCRLALVDLRSGAVEADYPVCARSELPTGLALEDAASGLVAYLTLWRQAIPAGTSGAFRPAGTRTVRLEARTGAPVAEVPSDGLPRPATAGGSLVLAPGSGGTSGVGRPTLYAIDALPGTELATWGETELGWQYALSAEWRLRRPAPDSLEPEAELRLDFAPAGLAVSPDGAQAYAFDQLSGDLVQVDLTTGYWDVLARVPGYHPWGLAVTSERLYAAHPRGGQVWSFDRSDTRRLRVLRVGRAPTALGISSGAATNRDGAPRSSP
jgi:hypothetical protein